MILLDTFSSARLANDKMALDTPDDSAAALQSNRLPQEASARYENQRIKQYVILNK
jgi:hypothetical protein